MTYTFRAASEKYWYGPTPSQLWVTIASFGRHPGKITHMRRHNFDAKNVSIR